MPKAILFFIILLPFLSYSQNPTRSCANLRECVVYSRSQKDHQPYRISIGGSTLIQVNLVTGDSSIWSVQWVNECGFIMRFLSGNDSLEKGQQYYLKRHAIALEIENITQDYYLYSAYKDRIGHSRYARDTFWVHQH